MKKVWKIALVAVMAILMGTVLPLQVFAAAKPIYISDIRMANAEDAEDAKKELEDAGYTVLDSDLNAKTKENFVFIGYKTTSDPKEAVTDIKAVKEKNGYMIFNSEDIMSALQGEALEDAIYLKQIIDVFRENYRSGQNIAETVYSVLQMYRYSDGLLLGDFLINPELTENELTDIVLNAAPEMTNGLYQLLSASLIPDSGETCFTRFDMMEDKADYDEEDKTIKSKARILLAAAKSYQLYVHNELDACEADVEENGKNAEPFNTDVLYSTVMLNEHEFDGTNLFDVFMDEELTAEDLYALASCMTNAEVQALKFLGVAQFIDTQAWNVSEYIKDPLTPNTGKEEAMDFWEGSTKRQGGRIAITNDVYQKMIVGDTGSLMDMLASAENVVIVSTPLVMLGAVVNRIASAVRASYVAQAAALSPAVRASQALSKYAGNFLRAATQPFQQAVVLCRQVASGMVMTVSSTSRECMAVAQFANMTNELKTAVTTMSVSSLKSASTAVNAAKASIRAASAVMTVSIVLTAIAVIVSVIFFAVDLISYYNPQYSEFPEIVLSEETLADGSTGYVYYSAVFDGERVGDTNAREGKAWNALYTTKSSNPGAPLRASSLTGSQSSATPEGMLAVAVFGSAAAFDLNTNAFSADCGTYLFFARVDENTLASVFADYNIWFIAGGTAALAIVAAAVIIAAKKKKAKA